MSGKGKRKAEDDEDVVVVDEAAGGGGKKAPKKPKGDEGDEKKPKGDEKKPKAPPKPKVVKLKPFTEEEERIAKGASMERNAAIANFLDGVREAYKQGAEYFKAAAVKKAVDAVRAHDKPFRVAQELGALPGCGKGTVDKVAEFLRGQGEPATGLVAEAAAAAAEAGRDAEFSWVEDSEREVVVELLRTGGIAFDKVQPWRKDIVEADFQ